MAASLASLGLSTLMLQSQATDRTTYLQRPDLGRRLDAPSLGALVRCQGDNADQKFDVAFAVVDGLSPLAIHQNALPFMAVMLQRLTSDPANTWTVAPVAVVSQGRVAVGDEVGEQLRAKLVVVLIGERPGLSSPDSMGLYITWNPKVGTTDAARNCISNVRPAGLSLDAAALTLHQLLSQARTKQLTGVGLKDDVDHHAPPSSLNAAEPEPKTLNFWQNQ
jgi:ethanolamine ammonia-lyase small subunit